MAIKQNIKTPQGFDAADAYGRVNALSLKNKHTMNFSFAWFKDENATTPIVVQHFSADYLLNGINPLAQAYLHLKSLPAFADAADC